MGERLAFVLGVCSSGAPVEGALGELGSLLLDMFAACEVVPTQQWLVCDDFNGEDHECEVVTSLQGWVLLPSLMTVLTVGKEIGAFIGF